MNAMGPYSVASNAFHLRRVLQHSIQSTLCLSTSDKSHKPKSLDSNIRCRYFTKEVDKDGCGSASPNAIDQVLKESNLKIQHGFTSIITQCPKNVRTAKKDNIYINKTTGHFICEHCNKQGMWPDLLDNLLLIRGQRKRSTFTCFNNVDTVYPYIQEEPQATQLWDSYRPFGSLKDDVSLQVLESFGLEDISPSTLDKLSVRCDPHLNSIVYPVIENKLVTSLRKLNCSMSPEESRGQVRESTVPKAGSNGLFGLHLVPSNVTEVVLTSSEVDAMAVLQETKKAAIALPKGLSTLPQEVLPSLERFKTIILWFGDDIRSWETAKLFSKKLNSKRCHIIRPSMEEPGPFTALTQGRKLSSILSRSRPISHDSIVNFAHLRQEVLSQLLHSDQVAGVRWKRYPVLNRLLKGHRRGELTVFTGPTGSGKTTFISDYSLDLCMQGVNTLWGSFEINNVRLGKMMLTQFAQQNLSKKLDLFDHYADKFQTLPMYFMTFHGQESLKKVIDAMSHAVYVHDIAHIVLDNLQFMMGSGGSEWSDRFIKQDSMISAFRKFATNMNCHVSLVIHPRKEKETEDLTTASVFGTAKATQEADNVLILQDKRLTSVRGRKYLQVTKNRFDGELGIMLLKFDKESLSFASKETKETTRSGKKSDQEETAEDSLSMTDKVIQEKVTVIPSLSYDDSEVHSLDVENTDINATTLDEL